MAVSGAVDTAGGPAGVRALGRRTLTERVPARADMVVRKRHPRNRESGVAIGFRRKLSASVVCPIVLWNVDKRVMVIVHLDDVWYIGNGARAARACALRLFVKVEAWITRDSGSRAFDGRGCQG